MIKTAGAYAYYSRGMACILFQGYGMHITPGVWQPWSQSSIGGSGRLYPPRACCFSDSFFTGSSACRAKVRPAIDSMKTVDSMRCVL
jgi:hypothetical protein